MSAAALAVHEITGFDGYEIPGWREDFAWVVRALDEKVLLRWTEALRSPASQQCRGRMRDGAKRCALGVLQDVAAQDAVYMPLLDLPPDYDEVDHQMVAVPQRFPAWLMGDQASDLKITWLRNFVAVLNDVHKLSFAQIADLLDAAAAS